MYLDAKISTPLSTRSLHAPVRVPKLTGLAKKQSELTGYEESCVLSSLLWVAFLSSGTLGVLMRHGFSVISLLRN